MGKMEGFIHKKKPLDKIIAEIQYQKKMERKAKSLFRK